MQGIGKSFFTVLSSILVLFFAAEEGRAASSFMPRPETVKIGEGKLALTGAFAVTWQGDCRNASLERAIVRFQRDVERLSGIEFASGDTGPALTISCRADKATGTVTAKEAYRLSVTPNGVRLEADGPTAVLRGLATLRQSIESTPAGASVQAVTIDDRPRFAWRGLMIDTARHFMTLATLKRQIDAMELVKLNVLHLHLSDNEGFRVESKLYPRLQLASGGRYYTQNEIRDLVAYAMDRGVRIVPEFDVPGHTRALIDAYPELAAHPGKATGAINLFGPAVNPASEATYRFLDRLFGEMAGLFPDAYFHAGGDEVTDAAWAGDPQIEAFKVKHNLADKVALEAYFHLRVREILRRHGRTMIGWDEVTATGTLPRDALVQAWQTSNATAKSVAMGYRTIVSAGYYLDLLDTAAAHYARDPADMSAFVLSPATAAELKRAFPQFAELFNGKVAKVLPPLTPEQEGLILGAEAPIWSELVTDEMLDARLWPRAAALAERFWSRREVRDADDMYRRLAVLQDQLRLNGVQDLANRARMASRLAPGDSDPVLTLLGLVGSVRNMAHDKRILAAIRGQKVIQNLNDLADAAPVDSLVARGFIDRAARLAGGQRDLISPVRGELEGWIANHRRVVDLAVRYPVLADGVKVSADIAELADVGLAAIDALERNKPMAPDLTAKALAAIERAETAEAASARPIFSTFGKRPPADLIIMITPGIRSLVMAAGGNQVER